MYPILCKVRYETLHRLFRTRALWIQIGFTRSRVGILTRQERLVNRTGSGWSGEMHRHVLIWNGLAGGDDEYCAILVAVNSILQMVLYAPLAILFIKVISRENGTVAVSYEQVATSVAVFLGIPLGAAILTRLILRKLVGAEWYEKVFLKWLAPWSLFGLLYTILVLFASQGRQVVHQIVSVVRVAAPLIAYFMVIFFFTLFVCNKLGYGYKLGATQSFTAASNNFELAIAVAVATYGPDSDQALAATVGPLIEVPVLIGLVYLVRWMGSRWAWKKA
ncbi:hypothetical protein EKO04_011582 [Ascochyta lentis]|uniref:Arsenite transporter n=1 Tax=Ascochyta lentis TaxID=205686 RepID=A0A8H7IT41_9PLEO|nr:hypothetical protein EKO04_011582 [Ascochyta lentis]